MGWGQQVRIRHVTSGRYLGVTHDNSVITVHRNKADEDTCSFYLRMTKVRSKNKNKVCERNCFCIHCVIRVTILFKFLDTLRNVYV